jgi:ER-derived vesicles protein
MLSASTLILFKRYTDWAALTLFAVVVLQGFAYKLIFDLTFFLRGLSVVGGLFMVFSDSIISRKAPFAGIPSLGETDRRK